VFVVIVVDERSVDVVSNGDGGAVWGTDEGATVIDVIVGSFVEEIELVDDIEERNEAMGGSEVGVVG